MQLRGSSENHGRGNDVTSGETGGGAVTIREVYSLINTVRNELLAELGKLSAEVKAELNQHEAEHARHELEHIRDRQERAGRIKWAVTTIIAFLGVLTAIIIAVLK
jgi:hypothetical protein